MSLTLGHNGHEWHGTFGVVLTALFADLLPEGPVKVRITWEDDNKETLTTGEAVHVHRDGDVLYLRTTDPDSAIRMDDILRVEVE